MRAGRDERVVTRAVAAALVFTLAISIGPLDSTHRALAADSAATLIARYRARIPELMDEQGIPGLAAALIDADQTLWVEDFGHIDRRGSAPVTADTIVRVQSTSELFTAQQCSCRPGVGSCCSDQPSDAVDEHGLVLNRAPSSSGGQGVTNAAPSA